MKQPDYVAQAHCDDIDGDIRGWLDKRIPEAKAEGCVKMRASVCPQGTWPHHNLVLLEGWKDKDAYEGDPHWLLMAAPWPVSESPSS